MRYYMLFIDNCLRDF